MSAKAFFEAHIKRLFECAGQLCSLCDDTGHLGRGARVCPQISVAFLVGAETWCITTQIQENIAFRHRAIARLTPAGLTTAALYHLAEPVNAQAEIAQCPRGAGNGPHDGVISLTVINGLGGVQQNGNRQAGAQLFCRSERRFRRAGDQADALGDDINALFGRARQQGFRYKSGRLGVFPARIIAPAGAVTDVNESRRFSADLRGKVCEKTRHLLAGDHDIPILHQPGRLFDLRTAGIGQRAGTVQTGRG